MMTSTMSLKEEKQLMLYISQLKANKPLVGKYSNLEASATKFEDNSIFPLKARLEKVRDELIALRNARRDENECYRCLILERKAATEPVNDLIDERNNLTLQLNENYNNRRILKEDHQREMAKWHTYMTTIRSLRSEQIKEEKAKRAIEQERINLERQLERVDDLYNNDETLLLQQTIAYVKKMIHSRDEKSCADNTSNGTQQTDENKSKSVPQGDGVALLPKNQREAEYYVLPKAKKCSKKQGIKSHVKPKVIKHDIGTFHYFEECGVNAPVKEDDLESCLKQLEEKYEGQKRLQASKLGEVKERKKAIQAQLDALGNKCQKRSDTAEKNLESVKINAQDHET